METLYLDRRDALLDLEDGAMVVRVAGTLVQRLPLRGLERVIVKAPAQLGTRLLAALWEQDVGLLVLSGRRGEASARLVGRPHADVLVRQAQLLLARDEPRAAALARRLIRAKLLVQRRVVRAALAAGRGRRHALLEAERRLVPLLERLRDPAPLDRAAISGIEGAGAAAFLLGLQTLFPPALGFTGRNRRPPLDPVNAVLSLGYTLLHHDAVRTAQLRGLDPFVGVLHSLLAGRESLASDLIEPLRPDFDAFAVELFRAGVLRADDFRRDGAACLLGKAGRQRFYAAFEAQAERPRRVLDRLCRLLVRELRGRVEIGR
jgi:CRISPR-associated protein Cas1